MQIKLTGLQYDILEHRLEVPDALADWGDCSAEDKTENELSLKEGFRIFSVYHTKKGAKIWVITEADRSSTCILLPEEY